MVSFFAHTRLGVGCKILLAEEHVLIVEVASEDLLSRVQIFPALLTLFAGNMPLQLLIRNNMILEVGASY